MKFFKLLFVAFPALIMISCDDSSGPSEETYLMPMKIGSYWITENISTSSDGSDEHFFDTTRIVGEITYKSEKYYVALMTESDPEINSDTTFMINRKDGLYLYDSLGGQQSAFLKYPGKVGDKCNFSGEITNIDSISAKVTTKAGSFTCYKYTANIGDPLYGLNVKMEAYFSPGTGIVMMDIYSEIKSYNYSSHTNTQLIEYKL